MTELPELLINLLRIAFREKRRGNSVPSCTIRFNRVPRPPRTRPSFRFLGKRREHRVNARQGERSILEMPANE